MRIGLGALTLLMGSLVWAQGTPPAGLPSSEGVRPRSQPREYAAQVQESNGTVLAASILPADQVKQRFAFDISKNYVVVEVACYPKAGPVTLRSGDFLIRLSTKAETVMPAEAPTVAAAIQRKSNPPPASTNTVYTEANVGYASGTDPYTGRRVSSVYTGAGVGVGHGDPYPPMYPPSPGAYPEDRALLEEQLWHRGLPEGSFDKPVAGYLYFPTALLKKEKGYYLMQVMGEPDGKWELRLPLSK